MNYTFLKIGLILKLIDKTELILFSEEEYIKTKKNIYLDIISLSEKSDLNKFIEILDQNSSQITKDEFDKVNSLFLFLNLCIKSCFWRARAIERFVCIGSEWFL